MYPLRIRRRHCERSEAISSRHPTLSMAGDGFVAPLLERTKGATDVAGIIAKQSQGDAIRRGWRSAATMKKAAGPLKVRRLLFASGGSAAKAQSSASEGSLERLERASEVK